jgi:hypothetical protein
MRLYFGGVIAERNILSPLCLLVETAPFNLAFASGNGNRYFTQKLHVKIENNPRSSQSQTDAHIVSFPTPLIFRYYLPIRPSFVIVFGIRCPEIALFKTQYEIAAT